MNRNLPVLLLLITARFAYSQSCIDVGVTLDRELNQLIFSNIMLAGDRFLAIDGSGRVGYSISTFNEFRPCNGFYCYSNVVGGIPCDGYNAINESGAYDGTYWREDIKRGKIDHYDLMIKNKKVDSRGYPLSIPLTMSSADSSFMDLTVVSIMRQINLPPSSPQGEFGKGWVLRYKGKGVIEIGDNIVDVYKKTSNVSGILPITSTGGAVRMEIKLREGLKKFDLIIYASNPADPIRDMELLYPGTEALVDAGNNINPEFTDKMKNFKMIRFKECLGATSYKEIIGGAGNPLFPYASRMINFDERVIPQWYWQNGRRGMALEYIIEICNQTRINPWFCLPYCGSQDYFRDATKLIMDKLDPDLIAYLEVGHNFMFWEGEGDNGANNGFYFMNLLGITSFNGVPNGSETGAFLNKMFKAMGEGAGPRNKSRIRRIPTTWFDNSSVNSRELQNIDPDNWECFPQLWNVGSISEPARQKLIDYFNAHPNDENGFNQLFLDSLRAGFKRQNKWTANRIFVDMYKKQLIFTEGGLNFIRSCNSFCANGPDCTELPGLEGPEDGFDDYTKYPCNKNALLNAFIRADSSWAVQAFLNDVLDTMQQVVKAAAVCYRSFAAKDPTCFGDESLIYKRDLYASYDTLYKRNGRFRAFCDRKNTANCDLAFQVKSNRRGPGQALLLDGVNDYVKVGIPYLPDETRNYTIETWFMPGYVGSTDQDIVSMTTSGPDINFNILRIRKDGRLNWSIGDNLGDYLTLFGPVLTAEKWYHVAVTKNSQRYTLYLNGKNIASENVSMKRMTRNTLSFGGTAFQGSSVNNMLGNIDEARLWNIARAENDIRGFMCKKVNKKNCAAYWSNLRAYYRFDDADFIYNSIYNMSSNSWEGEFLNVGYNRLSGYSASGAALGDSSLYYYPQGGKWAGAGISLQHPQGDRLAISNIGSGDPDGAHIYYVDSTAWYNEAPKFYESISTGRYWGVFLANGLDPVYDVSYFYNGQPQAKTGAEASMNRLLKRNSSNNIWEHSGAGLNVIMQSLDLGYKEKHRAEYTIAFREDLSKIQPGAGKAIGFKHPSHTNDDGINHGSRFFLELNDYTVSFWAKGNGAGSITMNGYGKGHEFEFGNGTFNIRWNDFPGSEGPSNTRFDGITNEWIHYAAVKKGQLLTAYVNGYADSGNVIGEYLIQEIRLFMPSEIRSINLSLDEFAVFNTALDEKNIRDLMCKKITDQHPYFCKNLMLYFNFDEGQGNVLEDKHGPNDLVLDNMSLNSWTTSGAPVGDESAYNYTQPFNAILTHPNGDFLEATLTTGTSMGVQLYRIDNHPPIRALVDSPAIKSIDSSRYWGIYVIKQNSFTANYEVVNHYEQNGRLIPSNESQLRLLSRANGADTLIWHAHMNVLPNLANHTLTLNNQLRKEYVLGGTQPTTFLAAIPPAKPYFVPETANLNRSAVCGNSTQLVYRVNYDPNVTGYGWTIIPQNILTGTSKSDSISVNANYSGPGIRQVIIAVTAFNQYGKSDTAYDTIIVYPSPTLADAGPDKSLAPPEKNYTMNGNKPASGETALWQLVSGMATLVDENNPGTAVNDIGPGINRFLYSITSTSGCPPTQDSMTISYGPAPVNITMSNDDPLPVKVCEGTTWIVKAVMPQGFAPSDFKWNLPSGMILESFTQNGFATIYMDKGYGGRIGVQALYSGIGSDEYQSPDIALTAIPNNPVITSKQSVLCGQHQYTFTCNQDATIDSFDWALPYGLWQTVTPNSTSYSITINTPTGKGGGTVKVTAYNNGCTSATASDSFNVTIDSTPPRPGEKGHPYGWKTANGNMCNGKLIAFVCPDDTLSVYKFFVDKFESNISFEQIDSVAAIYDLSKNRGGSVLSVTRTRGTGACNESAHLTTDGEYVNKDSSQTFITTPVILAKPDTANPLNLRKDSIYTFTTSGGLKFVNQTPHGRNFYWVVPEGLQVIIEKNGSLYDSTITVKVLKEFAGYLEVYGMTYWGCIKSVVKKQVLCGNVPFPPEYVSGPTHVCQGSNFNITVTDAAADEYIWTLPDGTEIKTAARVLTGIAANVQQGVMSVKARRGTKYSTAAKIEIVISPSVLSPLTFFDAYNNKLDSLEICEKDAKLIRISNNGATAFRWLNLGNKISVRGGKHLHDSLNTGTDTTTIWDYEFNSNQFYYSSLYNGLTNPTATNPKASPPLYEGPWKIWVHSYNTCGADRDDYLPYYVPTPAHIQQPVFVEYPTQLCVGSSVTFEINKLKNINYYVWELPEGITSSSTITLEPKIVVNVKVGAGGQIKVHGVSNACDGGDTPKGITTGITIIGTPVDFTFTQAPTAGCGIGDSLTFAVSPLPGTNYTWNLPGAFTEIIIDDLDTSATSRHTAKMETLLDINHASGYKGHHFESRGASTMEYIADLPYNGKYKVQFYNAESDKWERPVSITISGKTGRTVLNYIGNNNPIGWVDLGEYDFDKGRLDTILFETVKKVFYDAVKFEYLPFNGDTIETFTVLNHNDGPVCVTVSVPQCTSGFTKCTDVINTTGILRQPTLQGPTSVCAGQQYTYTVSEIGAGSYNWILPDGMSINGKTGTVSGLGRSADVRIDTLLPAPVRIGVFGVIADCNVSGDTAVSEEISMSKIVCPLATPLFDHSPDSVCLGSIAVYSVLQIPGAEQYEWTLPDGITQEGSGKTGIILTTLPEINLSVDKAGLIPSITVKAISSKQPSSISMPTGTIISIDVAPSFTIAPQATCPGDKGLVLIDENPLFEYSVNITGATSIDSTNKDSIVVVWGSVPSGNVLVTANKPSIVGCSVSRSIPIDLSGGETTLTCPPDIEETVSFDTLQAYYNYIMKDTLKPTVVTTCGYQSLRNSYDSIRNGILDTIRIPIIPNQKNPEDSIVWTLVKKSGESISCTFKIRLNINMDLAPYTAFSPNSDGVNDKWNVGNIGYYPGAVVRVFDRWGQLVFECKTGCDLNMWDGRDQKGVMLPSETYHFIITQNNRTLKMGYVTLIR